EDVMVADPVAGAALEAADPPAPPDDLPPEAPGSEDGVEEDLQVVARLGITVDVEGAGGGEHPVDLHQPGDHHGQVSQEVAGTEDLSQGAEELPGRRGQLLQGLVVEELRRLGPGPGIVEGEGHLAGGAAAS